MWFDNAMMQRRYYTNASVPGQLNGPPMTLVDDCGRLPKFDLSGGLQISHARNQPLAAGRFEIYLHPGLRSLPFEIDHDAIAKTRMIDSLADR